VALLNDGGVVQFFFVFVKSERRMNGKNAAGREKKRERRVGVEKKNSSALPGNARKITRHLEGKKAKFFFFASLLLYCPPLY
jgi:hypothetical protein